MGDSVQKYFMDNSYLEENKEELNDDILNILDLFRLLSAKNKLKVRNLIRDEKIF